jgi:LuxR family glucitol operon transcriptional activator
LRQRLSPADRAWQIAVTGIGGVGKSALALAIAHEYRERYSKLPPEECFEAIIWISAKEEVLTAFGRERANVPEQVLHTLEDVYSAIARVLEREDIIRAQPEEQNVLLEKALKRQRTLLIMDNLESVKDDRIKAFLRNLPPPTKAIITSRESLDVADVKPLTGLRWEEAKRLIEEECRVREVALTPQRRQRIFELTFGLPLPIKLGVARMAGGESFALVDRWLGDAVGELPEYCVKGQIDLVRVRDPNAWAVLLACALFDRETGASREALGKIANLSLADRDTALAQLQRLFLVNRKEDDRLWVLPIVQRFAGGVSTDEAAPVVEKWLVWLSDTAQVNGTQVDQDASKMLVLQQEYPNLRAAIRWCRERAYYTSLLQMCEGTWHYPYHAALYGELEEILQAWLDAARTLKATCSEAKALLQQARLLCIWERGTDALDCLDQADSALESCRDYEGLAESWSTRSQIAESQYDFAAATEWAQRIYTLGQEANDPDIILKGGRRHAEVESAKGNLDGALEWLDKVEPFLQQVKLYRSRISHLYRRARLLMLKGDYAAAEPLLEQTVNLEMELGDRRFLATDKFKLAQIYAATGRVPAARRLAVEARSTVEGRDLHSLEVTIDEFLDELSELP